jgi:hypothetical protein
LPILARHSAIGLFFRWRNVLAAPVWTEIGTARAIPDLRRAGRAKMKTQLLPAIVAGLIGAFATASVDHVLARNTSSQPAMQVAQAQRFELVDANGTVRGVFGLAENGPALSLLDPDGEVRLRLDQTSEGYGIEILDPLGRVRFGVGTTGRGFVGLNVRDASGAIRGRMFANDDGKQTGFQVQDPGAGVRAQMVLNQDGNAVLQVNDRSGATVWQAP